MNVSIVGGGIFGTTIAWFLAREGISVDLFERESDLLQCTTGINQYRLHRGFHYPRSVETIQLTRIEEAQFRKVYSECVVDRFDHYYCIAKEKSLTSAEQAKAVWSANDLEFDEAHLSIIDDSKIDLCVKVREALYDADRLRKICKERLDRYGVKLRLNTLATGENQKGYDLVVVATYCDNNDLVPELSQREYQFELCEKPVLRLPEEFRGKSIVVLDGPFMCFDPLPEDGLFVMGHVEHAIHQRTIGRKPSIPDKFRPLLNRGVVQNPTITNVPAMLASAEEFFPGVSRAEHIGSMFTYRTVLPKREHDDARPTLIDYVDERMISVFSGKVCTCIGVADEIVRHVTEKML